MSKNTNKKPEKVLDEDVQAVMENGQQAIDAGLDVVDPELLAEADEAKAEEFQQGAFKKIMKAIPTSPLAKVGIDMLGRNAPRFIGDRVAHAIIKSVQVGIISAMPKGSGIRAFCCTRWGQTLLYSVISIGVVYTCNHLAAKMDPRFQLVADGAMCKNFDQIMASFDIIGHLKEHFPVLQLLLDADVLNEVEAKVTA